MALNPSNSSNLEQLALKVDYERSKVRRPARFYPGMEERRREGGEVYSADENDEQARELCRPIKYSLK